MFKNFRETRTENVAILSATRSRFQGSRIYRLGEKSRVAELPKGVRGYAYTAMITIFFEGKLIILGEGSFYPSDTLDRTLAVH